MAGLSDERRRELLDITGFQEGVMPFKYLGIPLASSKLKLCEFSILLEALNRKIQSWPKHTLSYAGKIQLIGSVLQGIECYWMSILPIPQGVLDRIYGICRNFMWNSKHPPIAWTDICKAKEVGGLGLRDLKTWNLALLAKVLWRIQEKQDTLWIRWVHHNYLQEVDIWDWQVRHEDSPLIKKLLEIKHKIIVEAGSADLARGTLLDWFSRGKAGVSHAYKVFKGDQMRFPWCGTIWHKDIQPRHSITLWLLALDKLPANATRPYLENTSCGLCNQQEETLDHLYFQCGEVKWLWESVKKWLGMVYPMRTYKHMLRKFKYNYKSRSVIDRARHMAMGEVVYQVWKGRNGNLFEGIKFDGREAFRRVQINVYRDLFGKGLVL